MLVPASDEELAARQSALRAAADELLDELDRSRVFADLGPLRITGSYISELMCWRDLDVGLLVGPEYAPRDVVQLISRVVVTLPGVVGFDYRDERGDRCPTGQVRDERYHVPFLLDRAEGTWRFDLSLWLHDPHENVTSCTRGYGLRSPTGSVRRFCGSRTCGAGCPATPTTSAAWRSTRPSSTTGCGHRSSSVAGLPTTGCQRCESCAYQTGNPVLLEMDLTPTPPL